MKTVESVVPALWFLLTLGCSGESAPAVATSASLPSGSAARAGAELISAATVARIAESQGLAPRAAVGLAISDALFAEAAKADLPASVTRSIERAATARSLLEQLSRDAAQQGAPNAQELAEIVRERWFELDRPNGARTTHAIVTNDKPARDAEAHALADKLAQELRGVTSSQELMRRAKAFPAAGFEIRAEELPFVTPDARVFQQTPKGLRGSSQTFDPDYARAANALEEPGQLSPVTKSAFGYHVILLDERMPGVTVSEPELSQRLAPEILVRRAARARSELLDKLRKASGVQLERAFDDLTAQVKAVP
jgi:hypothetical protein